MVSVGRSAPRFACLVAVALGACADSGNDASGSQTDSGFGGGDAGGFEGSPSEMADELAAAFFREGRSVPSYTFVESQSMPVTELPPDVAAAGARAGAMLHFAGATAMDPTAFHDVLASFLVFDRPSAATAFYEQYQTIARKDSEIAVEQVELKGDGIPTSPMECIAIRGETGGLTCVVLEQELGIVDLLLYANGPAVETEYGRLTVAGLEVTGPERWFIKSFEDESFYRSVTMLGAAFHRYANETLGE